MCSTPTTSVLSIVAKAQSFVVVVFFFVVVVVVVCFLLLFFSVMICIMITSCWFIRVYFSCICTFILQALCFVLFFYLPQVWCQRLASGFDYCTQ